MVLGFLLMALVTGFMGAIGVLMAGGTLLSAVLVYGAVGTAFILIPFFATLIWQAILPPMHSVASDFPAE